MAPAIHGPEIALRLLLTVIAGGLLGFERSRTGHAAGLRTTLLVTLAASVAMIQMNLLIETNGKPSDSYAVMDLMRLPLGILTGVGFIGAGAIIRKDEMVLGITTAATLWYATVVGLCLGGGQLILGCCAAVLGYFVLWRFRFFEKRIHSNQLGELTLTVSRDSISVHDLRCRLEAGSFQIKSLAVTNYVTEDRRRLHCQLRWPSQEGDVKIPPLVSELEKLPGVIELAWKGMGAGPD